MRTHIYNSGMAALTAQDGQAWKVVFSGFKITDAVNIAFNGAVNTLPGNIVYTGNDTKIRFVPVTSDEVLVQCIVDKSVGQLTAGSLQLLVNYNGNVNVPFSLTIGTEGFVKLANVEDTAVGTRLVYQLMLIIPDLTNRFSFVNLKPNVAKFHNVANEDVMPRFAWEEQYDQVTINTHTKLNKPVFVLNAWDDYWGCPLLGKMSDTWVISGGVVGDGHRYVS